MQLLALVCKKKTSVRNSTTVDQEYYFQDKYLFYRFLDDEHEDLPLPTDEEKRESEEDLQDTLLLLSQTGPDAHMRMILRKPPGQRTGDDLEIIFEELIHIKALSHLSTTVKRELAGFLIFESHPKAGTRYQIFLTSCEMQKCMFNQGEEGTSWYIILKGSVNVVIYGKGVVCTLHEGDDFGKLALVNDAPRAASIVLREDNCHFLRVDKEDFNRILRDVEANTVRLKEHDQDVLVLEKIPSGQQASAQVTQSPYKIFGKFTTNKVYKESIGDIMLMDTAVYCHRCALHSSCSGCERRSAGKQSGDVTALLSGCPALTARPEKQSAEDRQRKDGNQGKHRVTKRGPALSYPMFTLVTGDLGIVGRWRAVCVTALQRPNSDAAAIRIVVGIAAASLCVTVHCDVWESRENFGTLLRNDAAGAQHE
ncbi:unnamed protein product [Ranitomeya imitator]|uniref:Cyclic nucleotide-binding domain-containing protein n=1 Tax=Ranitomeya imitator TaxID=111125 RepID=A0ABN9MN66_9NEOB|nr:unnamed protein product [Ranitomeya imitator]